MRLDVPPNGPPATLSEPGEAMRPELSSAHRDRLVASALARRECLILAAVLTWGSHRAVAGSPDPPDFGRDVLPILPDHVRNFLDCVKSRQDPIEPVEVGHRTATLCHLGNIAMRLKRTIKWDPDKEQIVGDDEATGLLSRPLREPWHI
jgi:hypothetical protein